MNKLLSPQSAKDANTNLLLNMKEKKNEHALLLERTRTAEEEVSALRKQLLLLKELCQKSKEQQEIFQKQLQERDQKITSLEKTARPDIEEAFSKEQESTQKLQKELEILRTTLLESQQHGKQLERVIQFLRERAEESHLEAKQLREEFQTAQEGNTALTSQLEEQKEKIDHFHKIIQEKQNLESSLSNIQTAFEETDKNLKLSQQHLAKKMREIASLAEKNEEQRHQIIDLQQANSELHAKLIALQQTTELQVQHEKRQQEQSMENARNMEEQSKRWESKYFEEHDKWQKAENRIKALHSIEEKYQQLQVMLTNITSFISNPPPPRE